MLPPPATPLTPTWAKLVDHDRCIGCHACSTACKAEHDVPLTVFRTYVKSVDVGRFPLARRAFQVTRCNQCERAPCVPICPTGAMFSRPDGIVDFDKRACIGCKACMAACPYDAIFINPRDGSAEKCNFCAHRLEVGLEPSCVTVCPSQAILVGDLRDTASPVAHAVARDVVHVRRPEKGTGPKVFYRGAHQATLDPLAARRPGGGLFMWSQQLDSPAHVVAGSDAVATLAAAAVVSYDVPHHVPWDWRVSLYTWTKSLAAGTYLVAALLVLSGSLDAGDPVWRRLVPLVSLAWLAATGAILVSDLAHPARFVYLFTRPRWSSWLVRGGWIIAAYGALLVAHLAADPAGAALVPGLLLPAGVALALATAVYTAFLFAQARGRDLWQSALLAPQMAAQAALAGAAGFVLLGWSGEAAARWVLAAASCAQAACAAAEFLLPHPTAHAQAAVRHMTRGRYASFAWAGLAGAAVGLLAPWLGAAAAAASLAGLLAYEHAYVQAGQSVPLA